MRSVRRDAFVELTTDIVDSVDVADGPVGKLIHPNMAKLGCTVVVRRVLATLWWLKDGIWTNRGETSSKVFTNPESGTSVVGDYVSCWALSGNRLQQCSAVMRSTLTLAEYGRTPYLIGHHPDVVHAAQWYGFRRIPISAVALGDPMIKPFAHRGYPIFLFEPELAEPHLNHMDDLIHDGTVTIAGDRSRLVRVRNSVQVIAVGGGLRRLLL